jgi:predicted Zn-dependent protease
VRAALIAVSLSLAVSVGAGAAGLCQGEAEWALANVLRIAQEWPLRPSADPLSGYARSLVERLARASGDGDIPWRVAVARNRAPNAFAAGGGYLYITDGALDFADNESELVAILAHEMGHQLSGHFCRREERSGFFTWLFGGGGDAGQDVRRHELGSLSLVVDPVKEQEADNRAVAVLRAAGYDPHAMLAVARRLRSAAGPTHLQDPRRIRSLEASLARVPPQAIADSEDFQSAKRALKSDLNEW